jgi:hypothetical protein
VTDDTRSDWESYSVVNKWWLSEGREYQVAEGLGNKDIVDWNSTTVGTHHSPSIYAVDENFGFFADLGVREQHQW